MRIFLTGGTGYIGAAVLDALIKHGHDVTALVRDNEKAATLTDHKAKKDGELDKDTMSQSKGLDGIKAPEIKTGDEHKKP